MTLCFDEAYQALQSERITEREYLHQVLAHFSGLRHPADEKARPWELKINDPVGNAIRDAALSSPSTRPEGIFRLEELFASTLRDDVRAVQTLVHQLAQDRDGHPFPVQAIAPFAALHNDVEVLRLCVELGASLAEKNTSMALEFAARGAALLDVLYEYDWRDMRSSRLAFNRMLQWSLHTGSTELTWFLEHGAQVDKDTIRHAVRGAPVKAACVELLIRRFGIGLFHGARLLQSAAKRGRNDVVKMLLDAGMAVDELIPRLNHDDGDRLKTALYEAVYYQHEETVQLLLAYGADPNKQVSEGGFDTPLRLAETHGYSRIVGMLHRSLERNVLGSRTWTLKL